MSIIMDQYWSSFLFERHVSFFFRHVEMKESEILISYKVLQADLIIVEELSE